MDIEKYKLTPVEIAGICGKFARPENSKQGYHLLAEMGAESQLEKAIPLIAKETRKEIGDWLLKMSETKINKNIGYVEGFTITLQRRWIDNLLRGEMPVCI